MPEAATARVSEDTPTYKGIILDYSRDDLMTEFGKRTTEDRYLLEGEDNQIMFARVAFAGADDLPHAQRLYDYFSQHWAMPATPVLSNLGTKRGLPISCFLNEVPDSLTGIFNSYVENAALASNGGGIGTYWGNLRGIGAFVSKGTGTTSGIVPFLKVMDSSTLAVSQGNLRRGSAAIYLNVHHPEIEEFIEIRRPTGGDINRKTLNLHHGLLISDEFMEAVRVGDTYEIRCPHTGEVLEEKSARDIWQRILTARLETGEPYIVNIDEVNRTIPQFHRDEGLLVKTSNLCSEISLPTNDERTAVCCLTQLNQLYYDTWSKVDGFIEDIVRFADNVLQIFVDTAPESMAKAIFSAKQERSLGIGVMGFHSYLQSRGVPFESGMAKSLNINMGRHIAEQCKAATITLAEEKGPCPDAKKYGVMVRNANVTAIAPTASVSIIAGIVSPSMEPWSGNAFTQKTLSGSFLVKNRFLELLLEEKGMNTDEIWSSIITNEGSVQHLECLDDDEKDVYKTAFEIDQRWVIEHAATRQPHVDQMISTNVFLPADVHKKVLHDIHFMAWEKGMKSLYYCRSRSLRRADKVSHLVERRTFEDAEEEQAEVTSFDTGDCMGCQ